MGLAFSIPQQLRNQVFYPAVVLKNAEMQFNFGDQPFKHEPPPNYIAVSKAPRENTRDNPNVGSAPAKKVKLEPNAPQAIIIEVLSYYMNHVQYMKNSG